MPCVRRRNAYHQVSDFERSRTVAYLDCGLLYRSIATRIGRDPMTICRLWNRWVQERHTERRAESQQPAITNNRKYRHLTHMALISRRATSCALNLEMGSCAINKYLHDQFYNICSSIDWQLRNYGFDYS